MLIHSSLESKNGDIILEKKKSLRIIIWVEYISKLFEHHRKDYNEMKRNFACPSIMKDGNKANKQAQTVYQWDF